MPLLNIKLTATTDSGGDATTNHPNAIYGWLEEIEWVQGTLAAGADAVISVQSTASGVARTLLTLTDPDTDVTYRPRYAIHDNTGSAISAQYDRTLLAGIPRVVVSDGGSAKTGDVILHYFTDR